MHFPIYSNWLQFESTIYNGPIITKLRIVHQNTFIYKSLRRLYYCYLLLKRKKILAVNFNLLFAPRFLCHCISIWFQVYTYVGKVIFHCISYTSRERFALNYAFNFIEDKRPFSNVLPHLYLNEDSSICL